MEAANAAVRSKGTFLAARYARIKRRRGHNRAAIAVAHAILVIAYHLISRDENYMSRQTRLRDSRCPSVRSSACMRRTPGLPRSRLYAALITTIRAASVLARSLAAASPGVEA